jgi:hypothetical protein
MNSSSDTSRKWHDMALPCHLRCIFGCIVVITNSSIIIAWIGMTFQFTIGSVTIFVTNRDMHNYLHYVG